MVALQERNFSTRADMYKGHKVVAMPSSSTGSGPGGALSVRDVVTSPRKFDPNRPRSLSAGRATTRSRDIVQEVYDRMGVNRGGEPYEESAPHNEMGASDLRGRSATPGRGRGGELSPESAEKFSQRYRAAAALSSPRNERGRNAEVEEPRRSRSLSRGRAVAGRWPPVKTNNDQSAPALQPVPSFFPRKTEESEISNNYATPNSPNRNPRTFSRTDSQEDVNGDNSSSASRESQEKEAAPAAPSIKDRISAYAGRNSARNFPQKKPANYQTYASRERPAPIDIYEDARKQEGTAKEEETEASVGEAGPPEPSNVPPSPAAAAAADAAFAFVRGGSSSRSVKSAGASRTPKNKSGIAGAYLGAIKSPTSSSGMNTKPAITTQTTSAPLTEISAADLAGDGHSVAASSVSADEFNFTSPAARSVGGTSSKKPTWSERNRQRQNGRTTPSNGNQYNNGNKPSTPSPAEIEKIVEQRVQARVSVVEMRFEEQMQRLERRVEEKLKMRIDMLDEKIDKMNSMLAMLLSRELNSNSGGREHRDNEI